MIKKTFAHFRELRAPVKAMVYLHYIYSFVGGLTGMFVNIFLYQHFESVAFNVIAQITLYASLMVGFSGIGTLIAWRRWNLKWCYGWAFALLASSFLFLYGEVTKVEALLFMTVNGFALGVYWLALHTFELTETHNDERAQYSSFLSAGDQIIDLLAPAIATLSFVISRDVFHTGTYTLLFIIAPLTYLLGFPLFRHLRSYRPAPLDMHDVRHFFTDARNRTSQLYYFGGSANYAFAKVGVPIAAILLLGTETKVGIFNSLFAVISVFAVLFFASRRHHGNQLQFLFLTSIAAAFLTLLPGAIFTLPVYVLYSIGMVVLKPLQRVSAHVIDLETMETLGRKERDFYPTMILRDVALGFWRIVSLTVFALLIAFVGEGEAAVRASFAVLAISFLLQYIGATRLYSKRA
jgi:hypothetical protein